MKQICYLPSKRSGFRDISGERGALVLEHFMPETTLWWTTLSTKVSQQTFLKAEKEPNDVQHERIFVSSLSVNRLSSSYLENISDFPNITEKSKNGSGFNIHQQKAGNETVAPVGGAQGMVLVMAKSRTKSWIGSRIQISHHQGVHSSFITKPDLGGWGVIMHPQQAQRRGCPAVQDEDPSKERNEVKVPLVWGSLQHGEGVNLRLSVLLPSIQSSLSLELLWPLKWYTAGSPQNEGDNGTPTQSGLFPRPQALKEDGDERKPSLFCPSQSPSHLQGYRWGPLNMLSPPFPFFLASEGSEKESFPSQVDTGWGPSESCSTITHRETVRPGGHAKLTLLRNGAQILHFLPLHKRAPLGPHQWEMETAQVVRKNCQELGLEQ